MNLELKSKTCEYDSREHGVSSDSDVLITYGTTIMRGTGFKWHESDGFVQIVSNASAVISDPSQFSPVGLSTQVLAITSESMEFHPAGSCAMFHRHVEIVNGTMKVSGDEGTAHFTERATVKDATVTGNVAIFDAGSTGACHEAFMDLVNDKQVLSGNACMERAGEMITGDRIVMLRHESRILCDSPVLNLKDLADPTENK